ncbi:NUDIX hydrolase [Pontibacter rugosus]|uniref:NUDIX domain-containing protein n=1 Tax=Pontibacter rugosus TaxID=1745966 RepID=A0ABW3STZ7_9BACT
MTIIDKLAWIEIKDNKILSTRSRGKDTFYIPGGKREAEESDHQALIREVKEELSIELVEHSIRYVGTFMAQAHGHPTGVDVKMQCYSSDYQGTIKAASEIEEVVWLGYKDCNLVSPVDQIIFDWLKSEGLLK